MASTAAWCIRTLSKRRLLSNATKLIVAFIPSFALGVTSSELQNMARIATNKQCQDIMAKVSLLLVETASRGEYKLGISYAMIAKTLPCGTNWWQHESVKAEFRSRGLVVKYPLSYTPNSYLTISFDER